MFCSIFYGVVIRIATKQSALKWIEESYIDAFINLNEKFDIPVFLEENRDRDTNKAQRQIRTYQLYVKLFKVRAVRSDENNKRDISFRT